MKLWTTLLMVLCFLTFGCSSKQKDGGDTKATDGLAETLDDDLAGTESLDDANLGEDNNMMGDSNTMSAGMGTYTVEDKDTLMWVAFKLYGDYKRWHELAQMNPNVNPHRLTPGTTISYNNSGFQWAPQGNPYLIQRGDSLSIISGKVYQTIKYWKDIWHNNQEMIKDPNLIFAGFTLYYRNLADVKSGTPLSMSDNVQPMEPMKEQASDNMDMAMNNAQEQPQQVKQAAQEETQAQAASADDNMEQELEQLNLEE